MSLKDLARKVKKLDKVEVETGWFETSKYPDGTPAAYVATIQEFGYQGGGVNIPPRPFMRPAEAENHKKWIKRAQSGAKQYLNSESTIEKQANLLGFQMQNDILDKIVGPHKPLSKITLLLRKWRDEGREIDKSTVEQARRAIARNPNIAVSANTKPLDDTNYLISSLTYTVET